MAENIGKTCIKCLSIFSGNRCLNCNRNRAKEYYSRTKDIKSSKYIENREVILEDRAKRYKKNKIQHLAYMKNYRDTHKEKMSEIARNFRINNPNYSRITYHNRDKRIKENGGKLSKDLSEKLYILQKGICPCCNEVLGKYFHLDHIMPIALGGKNEDWNIQLLHQKCNNKKYAKHPIDFMQSLGFLL